VLQAVHQQRHPASADQGVLASLLLQQRSKRLQQQPENGAADDK
jgi:hypothetical protein